MTKILNFYAYEFLCYVNKNEPLLTRFLFFKLAPKIEVRNAVLVLFFWLIEPHERITSTVRYARVVR